MSHIPFILRTSTIEDQNYIYQSYLKSYHLQYPMKMIPNILYFKPQSNILDFLFETAHVMVACYPEAPDQIIGWLIYQKASDALVIHYIYIRGQNRNQGIALDMISQVIENNKLIIATHISDKYYQLKNKVPGCKMVYDPFLITKLKDIHDTR